MFFLLRKIARLLRGKVTPFQIIAGCLLGTMLGFMPGWAHAPGLIAALSLGLILINANLLLAGLVGLAARLLALLLLPVTFQVGHFLLDGPARGFFKLLVNTPVLALFGFDSYVATGGLAVGGLLGLAAGLLMARAVTAFRRRMADAGRHSARYQELMGKKWMRFGVFVLAGGGMKQPDYAALLQKHTGNPIRPLGAVLVVLSLALGVILCQFFASTIVTTALRDGLEQANGATVDLAGADIDLKAGRMVLRGLAAADPNALDTDLFRAERIEADISGVSLLRKRLQLDRVVITGATSGEPRRVPGRRIASAAEPSSPIKWPDAKSIGDCIKNARVWRERLAQAQKWLDQLSGSDAAKGPAAGESLEARLQRTAAAQGYANVTAAHLVTGAPTLLISDLQANKVTVRTIPGESLDFTAHNLSTQPALAGGAPEISITSASDRIGFHASFAGLSRAGGDNSITFHYRGLPVDRVMQSLKLTGGTTLKGGTIDLAAQGRYLAGDGTIDLPLDTTLRDTTLTLNGRATKISSFTLPIGLTGPLDNPRIKIDAQSLGKLALQAGADALRDKAAEQLKGQAGGFFNSLLGGKK
jgi:uncharacterized protein (TIGR03546 family)